MIGAGRREAVALVDRLQALFAEGQVEAVTLSVGIALTGPPDYLDFSVLSERADQAMYQAKGIPGNSFQVFRGQADALSQLTG